MNANASVIIQMIDRFSPNIDKIRKRMKFFKDDLHKSGTALVNFGTKASKASSALANLRTGFAAAMLTRGLMAANKEAFLFSEAMNAVKMNTMATETQMASLRAEAKRLNAETRFTAVQAGETMAFLGQASLSPEQILGLMPDILAMATAGRVTPEASATLLSDTLGAYQEGIGQAIRYTNIMAFAATNSKSKMSDFTGAMKEAAGISGVLKIPFEDTAAILGVLAEKGERGASAGTRLAMGLTKLVEAASKDGGKGAQALNRLGIARDDLFEKGTFDVKEGGLIRFFELLDEKGATASDLLEIFTKKSGRMMLKMLGMSSKLKRFRLEMGTTTVTARKMGEVMMEGLAGAKFEAVSAWANMLTTIGQELEFITIPLLKIIKNTANWVKEHPKVARFIGVTMAIGAVLLTMVTILGVLMASVGSLTIMFGEFGLVALATGTAGATGFGAMATAVWAATWPILVIMGIIVGVVAIVVMLIEIFKDLWIIIKMGAILVSAIFKEYVLEPIMAAWEEFQEMLAGIREFFGFGKSELNATLTSPGNTGASSFNRTESVERVEIDINTSPGIDATMRGTGGRVPINLGPSWFRSARW